MSLSFSRSLCVLLLWSGLFSAPLQAATDQLQTRIASLLAANNETQNQPTLHITILTPDAKLAGLCPQPDLRLSGRPTRLTGNRSIIARCGNQQHFIQVLVNATGRYWIANHSLARGQLITQDDIRPVEGDLAHLPAGLLLDEEKIIGATPTRNIPPGQPLTDNQLRRRWAVLATKEVEIVAPGAGFLIHAKGKALNNAALRDPVRVQTRTGQIITATVSGEGVVSMNMEN